MTKKLTKKIINKKIVFLLAGLACVLVLAFYASANNATSAATSTDSCGKEQEEKMNSGRPLEIIYPIIPGEIIPKTVNTGLPQYVSYLFKVSVVVIGIIILGALIYSGILYLTSFGNPEKFREAKDRIFSAFLGALILLSAYLIFNTINPQLTILDVPCPETSEPVAVPGIYLCDYSVNSVSFNNVNGASFLNGALVDYANGDKEKRTQAVKDLKEVMESKNGSCFRANHSDNLPKVFNLISNTIFAVPGFDNANAPVYDYGIIFHEENNFQGKYSFPAIYSEIPYPYRPISGFSSGKVRSITVFKKPDPEPDSGSQGIILYQCLNYNKEGICPEGVLSPQERFFPTPPGADIYEVDKNNLGDLAQETRSIKIDPPGSYFALLIGKDNSNKDFCELIKHNDNNLLDNPIGRCGADCKIISKNPDNSKLMKACRPCLNSMIVIKGQIR